jgi:heme-degrading monooxygenase HmoA
MTAEHDPTHREGITMPNPDCASLARRFYRVDKFIVPEAAREEFLSRVFQTHTVLRRQPGFVGDLLLEQTGGPGKFNFVTVAEWESEEFVAGARAAVQAMHRSESFDPQELFQRLGIEPDLGNYRRIAEPAAPAEHATAEHGRVFD